MSESIYFFKLKDIIFKTNPMERAREAISRIKKNKKGRSILNFLKSTEMLNQTENPMRWKLLLLLRNNGK
jgi:rRNA processing protein Krr1/Pno1